ncbi:MULTISPECIES: PLP-dependent aminotransferase family protein [unclassified Devosia]|uniref:aminotransferase-like domain-containing protein n=1 Tax=unclassified Devosia TaxID=196773 RepID=UPI00086AA21C|nr:MULTISPECIES: PLP-dependent aminotransferase family protein [unclassified Devosia]MBN9364471.1 PLP-dependent aminotransferase family protein [Devosia sp.]ODS97836.1 MAG: GntR family transcriptional regulator [Devosia sp. SCN 66-27]OJX20749.1 MAG: GntR family transcriptional regulator [Devosia sp. 66-14]
MVTNTAQSAPQSLIERVMATIAGRIAARSLVAGARLPSVRGFARSAGVSVSTVVEAYNRLVAAGAIVSRPGSGFYVAPQLAPMQLSAVEPRRDRAIDPLWVSRQSLEADDAVPKPGCGWLPADWMAEQSLRRALRTVSRGGIEALANYGAPLGLPPLRQLISRRLGERGVEAAPDQIILTESGTQAIDLICRFLVEPGDTVLVDDPCYFNFQALLRAHRVRVVSVPYTPDGPDLTAFAATLAAERPRLYITNSAVHNPTGATLSPVTAHRVLKLAEQHGLTIIEDDIFADFEHTPAPRLAGFDGLDRVIEIGSFSKTLSASVRCGFIATRRDWLEPLLDLKIATMFGGARLNEDLVYTVLSDGRFHRHAEALRQRLERARRTVGDRLQELGIVPAIEPRAGMFLWCTLPDGRDSAELARAALTHGMVLAPGNAFSAAQTAAGFMRFNVAQMEEPSFTVLGQLLASEPERWR